MADNSPTPLKPIMIEKGSSIECTEIVIVGDFVLFSIGKKYKSPEDNCLTDNYGNDQFVTVDYLRCFGFNIESHRRFPISKSGAEVAEKTNFEKAIANAANEANDRPDLTYLTQRMILQAPGTMMCAKHKDPIYINHVVEKIPELVQVAEMFYDSIEDKSSIIAEFVLKLLNDLKP